MIPWMLASLALAAPPEPPPPPPPGLDLDTYEPWVEAARRFDEGPDGCWELEGDLVLRLVYDGGAGGLGRGSSHDQTVRGRVFGTFDDHVWTRFHYTLDAPKAWWMLVRPFWGDVGDDAVEAVDAEGNPLKTVIDLPASFRRRAEERRERFEENRDPNEPLFRESSVEFVEWEPETGDVLLREESTFEGPTTAKVTLVHRFPDGEPRATAFDVTLPKAITFGFWPVSGAVRDGAIHVRGFPVGDTVLPQAQRFSAVVGMLSHTVAVDSLVTFDVARRCVSEVPDDAVLEDEVAPSPAGDAAPPSGEP